MFYFTLCDKVSNQEKAVKVRVWKPFQVRQRKIHMQPENLVNLKYEKGSVKISVWAK